MNNATLKPYTINSNGADMTLEILSNKLDSGDIEIPEFQRQHVWQIPKASKLVESFLLGLPVPQIFLYLEPETKKWLVVDGQQRLKAVHAYIKGMYKGREFRLTGLDSQWNGKTFEDLNEPDKRRFKNATLRSTIFEQVDPADNTSIFEVFERLNTGGMSLTAQEVRNAVIGGDLNKLTKELNTNPTWLSLNNRKTSEDRGRDIELVLRLIALEDSYETYKKPMNTFLNSFLRTHKLLTVDERTQMQTKFLDTINIISTKFGPDSFKLKKGVNSALADAVYVGIARNRHKLSENLPQAYAMLLQNQDFIESIEQHTTDNDKVTLRIKLAAEAFSR
jgi:uncharacterized protein with ParB-like and HNH nuclease domain